MALPAIATISLCRLASEPDAGRRQKLYLCAHEGDLAATAEGMREISESVGRAVGAACVYVRECTSCLSSTESNAEQTLQLADRVIGRLEIGERLPTRRTDLDSCLLYGIYELEGYADAAAGIVEAARSSLARGATNFWSCHCPDLAAAAVASRAAMDARSDAGAVAATVYTAVRVAKGWNHQLRIGMFRMVHTKAPKDRQEASRKVFGRHRLLLCLYQLGANDTPLIKREKVADYFTELATPDHKCVFADHICDGGDGDSCGKLMTGIQAINGLGAPYTWVATPSRSDPTICFVEFEGTLPGAIDMIDSAIALKDLLSTGPNTESESE